jgi:hypothetical protein
MATKQKNLPEDNCQNTLFATISKDIIKEKASSCIKLEELPTFPKYSSEHN